MAEPPVEAQRTDTPVEVPQYAPYPFRLPPVPRPKVRVKADILPAVSVFSLVSLVGIPVGWLWSRLAPGQLKVVAQNGVLIPLTEESYHRFDAIAIFVALGLGAGLLVGVAVWFMRERRGPVVMIGAVLGSLGAAFLALMLTGMFTGWIFSSPTATKLGDVVSLAPKLESVWAVMAQPLATALAYGVLAAWNGMDDLGRRLG
ncbi:DUF2567 domain-containing protein [Actinocrispum wychmicini]|uniref:Uncharacterized protein DUF2567 n=1 Tax=Actinocrispum wychmicini TaxID=1213861 RepID=A0A4R2JDM8_9PSEU|nr:DUF2567 domain-containing protein [Actinocrispum wychmicini]TCO56627.1 uncharacterized protein DUF2567 [Actinocrispum wychmicini]